MYTPISHRSPAYRVIFIYIILSRATHFYYTEIHGPGVAQTRSHMRAALATHAVHLHLPVTLRKVCMQGGLLLATLSAALCPASRSSFSPPTSTTPPATTPPPATHTHALRHSTTCSLLVGMAPPDPFVLREPTRSEAPSPPGNQQTARPGAEMGESSSASSIHWSVDGSYLSTAASHLPLAKPPTTYR